MATQKVTIAPGTANWKHLSENSNYPFSLPPLPSLAHSYSENQSIVIAGVPNAVQSFVDPVNNTTSGFGSIATEISMDGFSMLHAKAIILTAEKVVPATALSNNTVIMLAGGVEVARIGIEAATGRCGFAYISNPLGDTRFALTGSGTALTSVTWEADDEIISKANHGLVTGTPVVLTAMTGGTGATVGNTYYFHRLSSSTGYLCTSYANAISATPQAISLDGTSITLTPQTDIGFILGSVDSNLRLIARILGADA